MSEMRAIAFRVACIVILLVGVPLRLNPKFAQPQLFLYSGNFETSPAGLTYYATIDLANMVVFFGALLIILSFTNLVAPVSSKEK